MLHAFWSALAIADAAAAGVEEVDADAIAQVERARATFDALARHCAENFGCPALLLGAEVERLGGREARAIELHEQAIELAERVGTVEQRALAHERLARLRLRRGEARLGALFLGAARALYAQWGAAAKVAQLDAELAAAAGATGDGAASRAAAAAASTAAAIERAGASAPPPAVREVVTDAAPAAVPAPADGVDLLSLLKAAQAIASEVELDRLLERLLRIALENAGADRACLVLEPDGDGESEPVVWVADAQRAAGQPAVARATADELPATIVNYVRRTGESVVVDDAAADAEHGSDPYVVRCRPRSLMAVAVRKQGRPVGVMLLEHSALAGAFTAGRIRVTQMLAAEAAIALENARLFEGLRREIGERRAAEQRLAGALAEVERLKEGVEAENVYLRSELIANVSHDLRTPLVSLRGYLELLATQAGGLAAETQRDYLAIALRQSETLATLVDELFELARLDFRGREPEREAFEPTELVVDVARKFELAAAGAGVALRVAGAAAPLPPVFADLRLVERVLDNLIGNALRHTPAGGTVDVAARTDGAALVVEVADSGCGIDAAELPFVFDRTPTLVSDRHQSPD